MKTFKLYYLFFFLPLFYSCQGPAGPEGLPGPQGPRGYDGLDGKEFEALMYETTFSLNGSNDWSSVYTFPSTDLIYTEDVVLVYMLWEIDNGKDIWRLMPVNYFYDEGILQINYDFTLDDVRIFAEAAFPLNAQIDRYDDLLARIVVIPADYSPNQRKGGIDYSNYEEVKQAFGLKEFKRGKGVPVEEILERSKRK